MNNQPFLFRINGDRLQALERKDYKVRLSVRDAKVKAFQSTKPSKQIILRIGQINRQHSKCASDNLLVLRLDENTGVALMQLESWIREGRTIERSKVLQLIGTD